MKNLPITHKITIVASSKQIQSCYTLMRQLRPHLTEQEAFIEQIERQFKQGYQLVLIEADGKVQALVGFRFLEFLAWGKVLYIDDLITDSETRKNGYATKLLNWILE